MKRLLAVLAGAALLGACGGAADNTAEQVHQDRADELREAADASGPEGANQLDDLADRHEQKADALGDRPADPALVGSPIPDNVSVGNDQAR